MRWKERSGRVRRESEREEEEEEGGRRREEYNFRYRRRGCAEKVACLV